MASLPVPLLLPVSLPRVSWPRELRSGSDLDQIRIRSGSGRCRQPRELRWCTRRGARGVLEVPDPCTRAPAPKLYARACRACVRSVCAVCAFVCVCVCRA